MHHTHTRLSPSLIPCPAVAPCLLQLRNNIAPLITTVVSTNKFEKEMAVLFGGPAGGIHEEVGAVGVYRLGGGLAVGGTFKEVSATGF